ncbi:hypothetical protein GCM10010272_47190 [Streptomyces lateritius]|nr:hypothetical protein GCM10010272_47190 [Streptomyces lateritius]
MLGKKIELASSSDPQDAEKAAKHPIDTERAHGTWRSRSGPSPR